MTASGRSASDFLPTASWETLRLRARLLQQLRHFFQEQGFLEVETPVLSHDTVVDRHLEPIAVDAGQVAGLPSSCPAQPSEDAAPRKTLWLQTSPEFGMKRLLAAGGQAIFQVTKAFRAGEQGLLHNPEFTLVEWYRVGDSMAGQMRLLDELADRLLRRGPAERLSYREAFQRHAGVDPHTADAVQLRGAVAQRCKAIPASSASFGCAGWLDLLLVECVQPHLGRERPVILYDYPVSRAALAQVRAGDPPVAERFELYVDGIELANGCSELLDADALRQRAALASRQRAADQKKQLPEESRLLRAMERGLPPCAGVALGFDRLVMVAAGAKSIRQVMAFPIDRA